MNNICKGYAITGHFMSNINEIRENERSKEGLKKDDIIKSLEHKHHAIQKLTARYRKHHNISLLIGSIIYQILNPQTSLNNQKYYTNHIVKSEKYNY